MGGGAQNMNFWVYCMFWLIFLVLLSLSLLFKHIVGYTTDDLQFIWQSGDPVQLEKIALPQFDIKKEDIKLGNCTKYYKGTGMYS